MQNKTLLRNSIISLCAIIVAGTMYDLLTPEGNISFEKDKFTGRDGLFIGGDENHQIKVTSIASSSEFDFDIKTTDNLTDDGNGEYIKSLSSANIRFQQGLPEDQLCADSYTHITPKPNDTAVGFYLIYSFCAFWPPRIYTGGGIGAYFPRAENQIAQEYDLELSSQGLMLLPSERNEVKIPKLGISLESH